MPSSKRFYLENGSWELVRSDGETNVRLHPNSSPNDLGNTANKSKATSSRAVELQEKLDSGEAKNRAELATLYNISRARVTQILGPMKSRKKRVKL